MLGDGELGESISSNTIIPFALSSSQPQANMVSAAPKVSLSPTPASQSVLAVSSLPLSDTCSSPHQHLQQSGLQQWTSAFLIFTFIYLVRHPTKARQLLKYASIIRSAAFRHAGFGWQEYDVQFCLKQACVPNCSWASN